MTVPANYITLGHSNKHIAYIYFPQTKATMKPNGVMRSLTCLNQFWLPQACQQAIGNVQLYMLVSRYKL
ncbi:hypothetical protein EUGRSUZ_J01161 [Eucalyptus grandis]|uniref:Uncharacterized protein n=2 Tax=Eucalyptus grandis TaxID=71139 RepID=A0ACC3J4M6_EUCGR|nr:hypothetical protein EUGRSUZ_J01161 [Eucalyptus grandis]